MEFDKEVITKRALGWGVGSKLILLRFGNAFLGTDVKYFQTEQKPRFLILEGMPYNVVSSYRLQYHEIQASLGFSYCTSFFSPYINAIYLLSHIKPVPSQFYVRFPDSGEISELVDSKQFQGQKNWGLALGFTLFDRQKASLSLEWRAINQNAINVNGEIRF
jgi:hypothetical protein